MFVVYIQHTIPLDTCYHFHGKLALLVGEEFDVPAVSPFLQLAYKFPLPREMPYSTFVTFTRYIFTSP